MEVRAFGFGRRVALLTVALTAATGRAAALEPGTLGGEPVVVDVTESTSVIQGFDNRDFRQNQVTSLANDDYGVWYNRLNLQAHSGSVQLGLRVDNVWFYASPDPTAIALELERERRDARGGAPDPAYFRSKVDEAGVELSNRYINWVYPAKYYVSYTSRRLELTFGDSYAEFGRGFVFSVRKQDELASDVTVRGVRATAHVGAGQAKLKLSALGGSLNPLRIDESSGRYLGVDDSVTPGLLALSEAGMPRAVSTDFAAESPECARFATCSYAPDRVLAAQLESRFSGALLGTQASLLQRQAALSGDVVRSAERILTASQSLDLPRLGEHLSLYVEGALQELDRVRGGAALEQGHALYASLSLAAAPLRFALEGKHYRRFFPLLANVSTAHAREFSLLSYSAPPTTEALDTDTEFESFNTCTTGARLKADAKLSQNLGLESWIAHYRTWAEAATNESCAIQSRFENRIYDAAAGFDLWSADHASHGGLRLGGRLDRSETTLASAGSDDSRLFYSELYGRYEVAYPLGGPFSLELTGNVRRRYQRVGGPTDAWLQGTHVASLAVAPRWAFALGFDHDSSGLAPSTYVNGEVEFRPTSSSRIGLFVGQRAGSLRCVGGVCRVFPPFEGARADATLRF